MNANQTYEGLSKRARELEDEVEGPEREGDQDLLKAHKENEEHVKERIAELELLNEQLKMEIEERKRSESALRLSKERFDLAVQGSKDGLWDWDITNNRLYFSPRLKDLLGYRDDEYSESFETWVSNIHPQDYERVLNALNDHLKRGKVYDVEYLHRNRGEGIAGITRAVAQLTITTVRPCAWSVSLATSPSANWAKRPCAKVKKNIDCW